MTKMPKHFSRYILGGLVLGLAVGAAVHTFASPGALDVFLTVFRILTTIFLNMVKMVVGPLIFATLTSGIANMGDGRAILRVSAKAMVWFLVASVISLTIGTAMALLLKPGASLGLPIPPITADAGLHANLSVESVFTGAFPTSIFDALSTNNILQIVVFSLFAGGALAALGSRGDVLLRGVNQLAALMLAITNAVMLFAPVGVFAAVAGVIAKQGMGVIGAFVALVAGFYLALGLLVATLLLAGVALLRGRLPELLRALREPAILAFSTSSSEAAYPKVLAALEGFGVPRRIASLVLPLGYSFNLDASMMYCTFGSLFIAQAYGIHLGTGEIVLMMLTLMLASKGIAAVPRGSLIALAATIPHFGLPAGGLLLLLSVDHFLNMGRSGVNVLGNALAVVAVSKWEGDERTAGVAPVAGT